MREMVQAAWTATLRDMPFDPERSWEDSGADSLNDMQLVLRLEEALGRAVAFDMITRDMTVDMLARRLTMRFNGAAHFGSVPTPQHSAFWLSGIHGDGPHEAEFRRAVADHVQFSTLDLADIRHPVAVLKDVQATATVCAGRIQMLQPRGPVRLAGYSFGGLVAFETAVQLTAAGRQVVFLAMLDTMAGLPMSIPLRRMDAIAWRGLRPGEGERPQRWLKRLAAQRLLASGATGVIRHIALWTDRRSNGRQMSWFSQQARLRFRWQAMRRYRLVSYAGPTLLVYSDEHVAANPVTRWQETCSDLRMVHLPGSHFGILEDDNRPALAAAFVDAITTMAPASAMA